MKNPNLELVFYASLLPLGTQMRVTGAVELLDDLTMVKDLITAYPFLEPHEKYTVMFRVPHGEAWFWTLEDYAQER